MCSPLMSGAGGGGGTSGGCIARRMLPTASIN